MSEPEETVSDSELIASADEPVGDSGSETSDAVPVEAPEAVDPDPVLLGSREIARAALAEITDAATIGADEGHEVHEQHVLTLFFECRLPGYPGWRWAATLSRIDEQSPVNVLEVELLPGEGAVTAPEWVPWSMRLAQYRETQARQAADEAAAAEAAAAELAEEDDVEPEDDLLENDFSDFEDEIDGVDFEDTDLGEDDEGDDFEEADLGEDLDGDDLEAFDDEE